MDLSDDDVFMETSLVEFVDLQEQELDAMLVDLDIDYQAATLGGMQHSLVEFEEYTAMEIQEIIEDIPHELDEIKTLVKSEKQKAKELGVREYTRETFWEGVGEAEDLIEDVMELEDKTSKYFGVEGDTEGIHKEMSKDIHEASHPIDEKVMEKTTWKERHKKKPEKGTKLVPYDPSRQRRKYSEAITPPTPMRKKEESKPKKVKRGKTVYFPSKEDPTEEIDLPPKGGGRRKKRRRR